MDPGISETVEKLKCEKKIIARKVLELSNTFKISIARLELKFDEKCASYEIRIEELEKEKSNKLNIIDAKLENISDDIEGLKRDEVKLSDEVSNLEAERNHVYKTINLIDETLQEIKIKFEEFKKQKDDEKIKLENENKNIRKPCKFNNKGYCRGKENFQFYHSERVCKIYEATGTCWKQSCRQRHPKICWYSKKCFRGESCRYLHYTSQCNRCEQMSCKTYHCEFCENSFCDKCIVEKAHINNIYENENNEDAKCEHIHQ